MELTERESTQVARIKEKLQKIKSLDPEAEVFGASKWNYQWPEPAAEKELADFEASHGIGLPREYRIFLRCIANGGPGFAYGLYPLNKTERISDVAAKSPLHPFMSHREFAELEKEQQILRETAPRSDKHLFYDGLLTIGTEGCTFDLCLVVTGEHRGRLIRTDLNEEEPFPFIFDHNFLDWYERWLDDFLAGMDMGSFGSSVPGTQEELRAQYRRQFGNPEMQEYILYALGRFPHIEEETAELWEEASKREDYSRIFEAGLRQLIVKVPKRAEQMLLVYSQSGNIKKYEALIKNLRMAAEKDIDIEGYIPALLERLSHVEGRLFSNGIWAIQKTSFNRFDVFWPLADNLDSERRGTVFWAAAKTPDFHENIDRFLICFQDPDQEVVRQVILSLFSVKDQRIPLLVDEALKRFPDLQVLVGNYHKAAWKRK